MRIRTFVFASFATLTCLTACDDLDGDADGDGDDGVFLTDPQSRARFDVVSRGAISETDDLMYALPSTRLSLENGIAQAVGDGFPISGKFEMADDGSGISLSVYTARAGREAIPEENQLVELAGSPTGAAWTPSAQVFDDYEHIARASQHLTLMALSGVTLDQVIRAAATEGTVYRVEPAVVGGRAAFEVLVATDGGDATKLELALH
jgi:hypothetical protein